MLRYLEDFLKESVYCFFAVLDVTVTAFQMNDTWVHGMPYKINTKCYSKSMLYSGLWRRVVRQKFTKISVGMHFFYLQRRKVSEGNNRQEVLVTYLDYSWTMEKEWVCSSETTVNFYPTTRRHIPEDDADHSHLCGEPQIMQIWTIWFEGPDEPA